jgi:hypothetical protein
MNRMNRVVEIIRRGGTDGRFAVSSNPSASSSCAAALAMRLPYHAWNSFAPLRCDIAVPVRSRWKVDHSPTAELVGLVEEAAGEGNREVPRTLPQGSVRRKADCRIAGRDRARVADSSRRETDPTGKLLAYRRRADVADLPALLVTSPQDRIYVRGE